MGIRQKSSREAHAFVVGTRTVIVFEGALRATVQKAIALALIATLAACSSPTTVDSSTPVDASDTAVAVDVQADHAAVDVPQDVQADASLCADGATMCPGSETCPNLQSDNNNCGTCGHRCTGGQVCTAGTCGCVGPQMLCGGTCIDTTSDRMHCGTCTTACTTTDPHAAPPTCIASACVGSCAAGYHLCTGTCVDSSVAASCGTMCSPCTTTVANATPTCAAGACGFACNPGYANVSGACLALGVPQQIAPLTATFSTSLTPTFRWLPPPRVTGARVEIYRDRACTMSVMSFQMDGNSGAPPAPLPVDSTLFWRLRGTAAGAMSTMTSPVWEFTLGHLSSSPGASFLPGLADVNGDGYSDVVVLEYSNSHLDYYASAGTTGLGGVPAPTQRVSLPIAASSMAMADVDGDGHADVIVMVAVNTGAAQPLYVYKGRSTGLPMSPDQIIPAPSGATWSDVTAIGDVNGDGVADVAVSDDRRGVFYVYQGRAGIGLSIAPDTTLNNGSGGFGGAVGASDINGDGFSDVVLTSAGQQGALVYLGGPAGIAGFTAQGLTSTDVCTGGCNFGQSIVGAGDINGDGYGDVVIGEYNHHPQRAFVYFGSNNAATPLAPAITLDAPMPSGSGFATYAELGATDLNGDGYSDLVIGADGVNQAYVYLGGSAGISSAQPSVTWAGQDGGGFGEVGTIGDIDGDGLGDVGIGANMANTTGRAYVYRGGTPPSMMSASTLIGPTGSTYFGGRIALLTPRAQASRRTASCAASPLLRWARGARGMVYVAPSDSRQRGPARAR